MGPEFYSEVNFKMLKLVEVDEGCVETVSRFMDTLSYLDIITSLTNDGIAILDIEEACL